MRSMGRTTIKGKAGQAAAEPKVEMTADDIKKWQRSYDQKKMEKFISTQVSGISMAAQEVRKASAVLARLSVLKDSPDLLQNAYGTLYRWIWHGVAKQDGDIRLASMKAEDCSSWKWVMQLNIKGVAVNAQAEWWDWISVRPSCISEGASLGVFAERNFPVGTTIGYYSGKITWKCDKAGTEQPTNDYLATQGLEESVCASTFLNTQAVYVVVEPTMMTLNAKDVGECLFLGLHYLVSPQLGLEADSMELSEATEKVNCQALDDGSVVVIRSVSAGSELLELLNSVNTAESENGPQTNPNSASKKNGHKNSEKRPREES